MTLSGTRSHLKNVFLSFFGVFHARDKQKGPVRANVEGACFCRRVLLSSFFFLSSLTQIRALKS